nr:hypothetical protein [Tanacetum cinerariifolium]
MSTPTVTSTTDSQMHNNIMAAGSKDHPPMLATGRYPQWRSRFLRYINTRPNGDALRKCILNGRYIPTNVLIQAVAATDDSLAILEHITVETPMNMSPTNKANFESEKEVIHLILTGVGDEIYLTIDACQTTQEMWEAIKRLQQGESLNIQDVKTNLFWEFARMVKVCDDCQATTQLDEVSYHKLFDILKQYHKEVNELRAKRLARNANPLALVAIAQANQDPYYQTSKSQKSYAPSSKPSIPTRTHITTRYKGKEIAKPITPPSELASEEDSDHEQTQKDNDMQNNLALIAKYFKRIYKHTNNNVRTSSNSRNKNVDTNLWYKNDNTSGQFRNQRKINVVVARENVGSPVVQLSRIQCFNCKEFGHFAKECRKLKRAKDSAYHKEKMLLCKQAEKGVSFQAEQYDWLADTDEEIDEQELESHYNYMLKIQEVPTADTDTDSDPLEQKANTTLAQELKECKTILAETSKTLGKSNSVRDSCLVALQNKQTEFEKYKAFNDRAINYDKLEKSVETKFDKPSIVRQLNAQRIPKPSVLGKPAPFLDSLEKRYFSKTKSVPKTNVSEGLLKTVTTQTLPQTARQAVSNTNVLKLGIYRIDNRTTQTRSPQSPQTFRNTNPCVSNSIGVNHKNNVSRPQLRSNQMKDKVVPNNSQVKVKKTQVEDHPRIPSISNKNKSVTPCNDSLNSRTLNTNAVCATCRKCLVDSDHFACVTRMLNDVNARTKKPNVVPISTRNPKGHANKSVATSHKKKVALKSATQKPNSYYRMLYEKTRSNLSNIPSSSNPLADCITHPIHFDSGCTKHMTGKLKLLCNFVKKFLGTVHFGNDQFAPILGYGNLVQGNITINKVYYVEGLNHNLFLVGQFCDADLEVAFQKSTYFVRDLQGNDLLIGNRRSNLYTISLQESTSSTPLCLMAKASPTQAWLRHRRLSHLNFDYINRLSKKDVVIGLPKLKYVKDQLCPSCEVKNKQEKDKIRTKPDQIKKKREAWKSPTVSKTNHSQ